MTNQEYLESHGKCIHTGTVGFIEAYIRMTCMFKGIEFDDAKIEAWLKKLNLDKRCVISCSEILADTIGEEYIGPYDGIYCFCMATVEKEARGRL